MKNVFAWLTIAFIGSVFVPITVHAKTSCSPPEEFRPFIERFSREADFQWSRIRFPYSYLWLDSAEGESKEVRELIAKDKVRPGHVFFPTELERAKNGLVYEISKDRKGMKVHLYKSDTDWSVFYYFVRENGCWRVTRIEDWSL